MADPVPYGVEGGVPRFAKNMGIAWAGPRDAGGRRSGGDLESLQEGEYRRVAGAMAQEHVDGIIVGDQLENVTNGRLIVSLADNARLPTVFPYREYFEIGALIAYGPSLADIFRRLAGYVDRILNGEQPGEMPIYLASKFELLVNQKTAKALGLSVPQSLLARADEVIE
jgi:putative ABC transport system substrate-binding protein